MSDEGFHEIQLNGKQLVFLFMAATVVSVVIFLCGVMVGRGVRVTTGAAAAATDLGPAAAGEEPPRTEPSARSTDPAPAPASGAPAPPATPPPDPDDQGYFDDLTKNKSEPASKVAPPPEREPKAATPPPKVERPDTAAPPPATATPGGVTGTGFVVQVAALRDRTEADAIVQRLAGKGYQAFVVNPVPGKPPVYKVQVGRFAQRGDAEKTAARLKSQEQYSPWVTR
jgi:cell division protein FtsN